MLVLVFLGGGWIRTDDRTYFKDYHQNDDVFEHGINNMSMENIIEGGGLLESWRGYGYWRWH
jgi:hypothetical protein